VPDTALAQAAEAMSAEASPPYLHQHCLRSYLWARLIAGHEKLDEEALFVGLMLHDLGLTEAHRPEGDACFTLGGARAAYALAARHGWPDKRAHALADAICLHINAHVAARHGRVAHWLRAGALADVVGLGLNRVPQTQRSAVVERHPRLGMKENICAALEHEAQRCSCGRIAYAEKTVGLTDRIRQNPAFAE